MKKVAIIADDLTGATDSGVQLAKKGLRSFVVFNNETLPLEPKYLDAIVIDTDSRALGEKEAYETVRKAALLLKEKGFISVYKKIDSTLRGNLGAEIQGLDSVFQPDLCIIAPAFPEMGRTTKEGIHYCQGVPVSETEIAQDPKTPVGDSSVVSLLGLQTHQKIGWINTEELGLDVAGWKAELTNYREQGVHWVVCDAETDQHLQTIASCVSAVTEKVIWVGSAGLIQFLPQEWGWTNQGVDCHQAKEQVEQVLVVSGSLSSVTKKQISILLDMENMKAVEVDPLLFFGQSSPWEIEKERFISRLISYYDEGNQAVLYVDSTPQNRENTADVRNRLGLTPSEVSLRISAGLAEIASTFLKRYPSVTGLVLTGGDTAKEVCRALGSNGIHLIKEIEPGLPLGVLTGDQGMYVITKAGAFGTENTLSHALLHLKGERS